MTDIYTATSEMCHRNSDYYGMELLPHDWQGKKFTIDSDGSTARLDPTSFSSITRWNIAQELAQKIKASVTPETGPTTEVTPEKHEAVCAEKDSTIMLLHSQISTLREEHETFKQRVGEVAMEYAERHDWCEVVKNALDEMGIEIPTKEYEFTLSVVYRVRGTKETYGEPDTYDIQRYSALDPDVTMTLDDWRDIEVEYVQHDVMDIEEVRK